MRGRHASGLFLLAMAIAGEARAEDKAAAAALFDQGVALMEKKD